jgi:hypothetical protein
MPFDYGIKPDRGNPLVNTAVLTTAVAQADIDVAGAKGLVVIFRLRGTVTAGDLATALVRPYLPDNTTLFPGGVILPTATTQAAVSTGVDVVQTNTYDLRGIQRVNARFVNNNAGTLNADIYYFLGY